MVADPNQKKKPIPACKKDSHPDRWGPQTPTSGPRNSLTTVWMAQLDPCALEGFLSVPRSIRHQRLRCAIGSINSHYFHIIGDKLINPIVGAPIYPWNKDSLFFRWEVSHPPKKTRQPKNHGTYKLGTSDTSVDCTASWCERKGVSDERSYHMLSPGFDQHILGCYFACRHGCFQK